MKITQKALKELVTYDHETGLFTWNIRDISLFSHCKNPIRQCNRWNTRHSGDIAGTKITGKIARNVYIALRLDKYGAEKAHRMAWLYMTGSLPDGEIDHNDQDGTNNKWSNIKLGTKSKNQRNTRMRKDNTSGFTGVNFCKIQEKWKVRVQINKKRISGGYFLELEDAIEKRKQMNIKYGFSENHGRIDNDSLTRS